MILKPGRKKPSVFEHQQDKRLSRKGLALLLESHPVFLDFLSMLQANHIARTFVVRRGPSHGCAKSDRNPRPLFSSLGRNSGRSTSTQMQSNLSQRCAARSRSDRSLGPHLAGPYKAAQEQCRNQSLKEINYRGWMSSGGSMGIQRLLRHWGNSLLEAYHPMHHPIRSSDLTYTFWNSVTYCERSNV